MTTQTIRRIFLTGAAMALLSSGAAHAQSFDRAAQAEARLEAMQQRIAHAGAPGAHREEMMAQREERRANRNERRDEARTEVGTRLTEVDAEGVQARLDSTEEQILNALANADPDTISEILNEAGAVAGARLENADGEYLNDEQLARLVAAAAYAEQITPTEVAVLLEAGALAVDDGFDELDAEAIAAQLNAIGERALEG